jgi:ATP-binding cassette subfamily C protein CydD
MRPLDPRLLRYASASRAFLGAGIVLGVVRTGLVLAFAWLLSQAIVGAITGVTHGAVLDAVLPAIILLAVVGLLRAATGWTMDVAAARGAAGVKSQLRVRLVRAVARLGPGWLASRNRADIVTTAGPGLDALDTYFSLFLPQLILTAITTPIVVVAIFVLDPTSGILVLIALPLIPIFMILIGMATQQVQRQQWKTLATLSSRFLDMIGGLATLKIFGRQHRQAARIDALTEQYRVETMKVLRMSFLSGFALELIGSLSVALVAVSVGLRLVDGSLGLGIGLFVLLLAPEAFLPLRQVGANYHAAADGVVAAEEVFAVLEAAEVSAPSAVATPSEKPVDGLLTPASLVFSDVRIRYDGRPAVDRFSADVRPGRLTVLSGPSGSGKSSLVAALLGFVTFDGDIRIGTNRDASPAARRALVAWAGQGGSLVEGTVHDNVTLGAHHPDPMLVRRALDLAALADLDSSTRVSTTGSGLSGGQAERVVAARAIFRCLDRLCPILVLDEPSAALDGTTEAALLSGFRMLASEGYTVLVVSHRPAVIAAADDHLRLVAPTSAGDASIDSLPFDPDATVSDRAEAAHV